MYQTPTRLAMWLLLLPVTFLSQVLPLLPSPMWLAAPCPTTLTLQCPLLVLFVQIVPRENWS